MRDLPQYAGGLAILPKHYWKDRDFGKSGTDISSWFRWLYNH